jgi:hypothetical protein
MTDMLGAQRIAVNVVERELTLSVRSDFEVRLELGSTGSGDRPPSDRPIVYLDQLHWVTLAQHLWAPEKVAERNREAAAELIALARSRRILLPFSSAHMAEAATTWGRRRHDFVLTVFSLSAGWQMTSPFRVRAEELRRSLSGLEPVVCQGRSRIDPVAPVEI